MHHADKLVVFVVRVGHGDLELIRIEGRNKPPKTPKTLKILKGILLFLYSLYPVIQLPCIYSPGLNPCNRESLFRNTRELILPEKHPDERPLSFKTMAGHERRLRLGAQDIQEYRLALEGIHDST